MGDALGLSDLSYCETVHMLTLYDSFHVINKEASCSVGSFSLCFYDDCVMLIINSVEIEKR